MNFKQSFRIVFRNKTYSLLNIAGLAVGIAAAALILLWVEYQFNFDKNIPKHKNLYRIGQHQQYGDVTHTFFVSAGPLFETLNSEFPEVKCNSRHAPSRTNLSKDGERNFVSLFGSYADSCIFRMLSMEFVEGVMETAFEGARPMVISQSAAEKLFGKQSPVGQTVQDEEGDTYEITGVFKDFRKGNSFQYDVFRPFRLLEKMYAERRYANTTHWGSNWHTTYVELHPGTDVARLNERLATLVADKTNGEHTNKYFVYPLDRLRLYGEFKDGRATGSGYIRTVRLFFWIGCLILLIACINFMNLSTARSEKRALEVGVRKTFGSRRFRLVRQFMGEAGVITLIALAAAVALIYLCLPPFNQLISGTLSFDFSNPYHYLGLLAIGAVCTLLAGSYPAFYLSSFAPLDTLKKLKKPGGSAGWIRKGLVVFQFAVSFVLICATLVIYLQIRHVQSRPLGFVKEMVMHFPVNNDIQQRTEIVRDELLRSGVVENAGFSSNEVVNIRSNGGGYQWEGKDPDVNPLISQTFVSPGLLETVGIKIAEGATFDKPADTSKVARRKVIINRTLAGMMGEAGRIGGLIGQSDDNRRHYEIAGIAEDFIFNDMYRKKPDPLIIHNYPVLSDRLFVKLREGVNAGEAQATIKNVLQTFSPNTSFDAVFMDDTFDNLFQGERLVGSLAALFAGLAIFISCLGLFGLSAFAAEQRTKEIGIRKVLGASVADILYLLGKDFMVLIMVAVLIGAPVAWYISGQWLHDYEYKITLSWGLFAATVALILLIALLTVSVQAYRAATANPVDAIQSE